MFAQNVILETMEYTVFRLHAADADAVTKDVLAGVISDERRHAGFGENDLGRSLAQHVGRRGGDGRGAGCHWGRGRGGVVFEAFDAERLRRGEGAGVVVLERDVDSGARTAAVRPPA